MRHKRDRLTYIRENNFVAYLTYHVQIVSSVSRDYQEIKFTALKIITEDKKKTSSKKTLPKQYLTSYKIAFLQKITNFEHVK